MKKENKTFQEATIYIENLKPGTTQEEVVTAFKKFGEVLSTSIRSSNNKQSSIIQFSSKKAAYNAMENGIIDEKIRALTIFPDRDAHI